jgi:uncharacterized membrane-anchored protein YhcB (DUF1043 family)
MSKTKAQLQQDLEYWRDTAELLMRRKEDYEALEKKYNKFVENYRRERSETDRLFGEMEQKHEASCKEYWTREDLLRENMRQVSTELGEAKAKVGAQETRIMVLETAMQSMTLHIQLLITQKKGKANA